MTFGQLTLRLFGSLNLRHGVVRGPISFAHILIHSHVLVGCRTILNMQTSFMQSKMWADFKSDHGWRHHQYFDLYVLIHQLKWRFDFAYVPELTLEAGHSFSALAARAQSALSKAKTESTVFGRAEFLVPYSESGHLALLNAGFVKSKDEVQPVWRNHINLKPSLSEIRDDMRSKGRYNLGLAEKKGVYAKHDNSEEAMSAFLSLNNATARRKGFNGRSATYLRNLINTLEHHKIGQLWVARLNGAILSAALIVFYGERASYLYGVSSDENRSVMSPYLLHFAIMGAAKARGCKEYDLIGVAPENASQSHPWAGISRFKREFGGQTVHYLGSYDRVYRPALYTLYRVTRSKAR